MTYIKERPILFQGAMVRALLAGTKTQTRRVVKMKPHHQIEQRDDGKNWPWMYDGDRNADSWMACPYGQPGDRLWVREAFAIVPRTAYRCSEGVQQTLRPDDDHDAAIYREGWTRSRSGFRWRPSIHMPRWASRITLEVTGVRVERLQEISEADALAEGCEAIPFPGPWWQGYKEDSDGHLHHQQVVGENPPGWMIDPRPMRMVHLDRSARDAYRQLWMQINGVESWESNPWIWAVDLKRLEHP